MKTEKEKKGIALIEVIVALSILVTGILSSYFLIISFSELSFYCDRLAANLIQEKLNQFVKSEIIIMLIGAKLIKIILLGHGIKC